MILLDTNVVVAHLNGDAAATAKISSHIDEIAVPAWVSSVPRWLAHLLLANAAWVVGLTHYRRVPSRVRRVDRQAVAAYPVRGS